jgi:hypothetical protein
VEGVYSVRLGQVTNALLIAVIRRTPFVAKAARNLKQWEDQFRLQLAAAGGQVSWVQAQPGW